MKDIISVTINYNGHYISGDIKTKDIEACLHSKSIISNYIVLTSNNTGVKYSWSILRDNATVDKYIQENFPECCI